MSDSLLTLNDALRNLGPERSAMKALREATAAHSNWLKTAWPSTAIQAQFAEMERLSTSFTTASRSLAADQILKKMEKDQRRYLDILKPLESFRTKLADFGLPDSIRQAHEYFSAGSRLAQLAHEANASASMFASIRDATATSVARLAASIGTMQSEKLAELTRPFAEMQRMREFTNPFTTSLFSVNGVQEALRAIRLPMIDPASAATIAQLWGEAGVERQLRALGIDAEGFVTDNQVVGVSESGAQRIAATGRIAHLDPWALFSIILTILIFFYQNRDSAQMEARLSGQIQAVGQAQEKQIEALSVLLHTLIDQDAHSAGTRFVVRGRVASVRVAPESGATVIASAFPNQVVRLIEERGKWIEIEYYDFILQRNHTGWALKKYFIRVRDSAGTPLTIAPLQSSNTDTGN